jgi:very-short-patch-repair endonuclease
MRPKSPHSDLLIARIAGRQHGLVDRSAAELWQLLRPNHSDPQVTAPYPARPAPRKGIRIVRSRTLTPSHKTVSDGIPVTTVARTLADVQGSIEPYLVRRAIRQAEFLGLELGVGTDRTRSDPERDFLKFCRRHGLPAPEVNVLIGGFTVDFLWRAQRLVVELDSWTAHRGRQAFEDDRERDLYLRGRGFEVRRFSIGQIEREPAAVAASLLADLSP